MTPCFQFGIVHYFTKVGSGEYYLEELEDEPCPLVSQSLVFTKFVSLTTLLHLLPSDLRKWYCLWPKSLCAPLFVVTSDQYASSWNVRQNIIGRGSQLTSSSRSRDAVAQCKWHSGVIQSPASLHFPDQPQARSDRKVTTSLAWLGSS